MKDFVALANQYAADVVAGKIPACRYTVLACQRQINDLGRQLLDPSFPYVFNPELTDSKGKTYFPAVRICVFAELQPHIKGDWAAQGMRIRLEGWQCFFLTTLFGWVHRETGKRRFRSADLVVPRKNAKSTIAAVIGLYMLAVDGEHGAEVYSGATSRDQAQEVFRPARLMASGNAGAEFRARFGVAVNASNISVLTTNSKFEPIIGKPGDGASPSCAIVDEYHEHNTAELYDTMKTGMGARSQPLLLMITTAGPNVGGPCYVHQVSLQRILEGVIIDERRFGVIYGIDPEDDWTDLRSLIKANPNYGISVDADFLKAQLQDALNDPRKQSVFKTKHLNIWVNAASPWLNLQNFQRCGDASLSIEQFLNDPAWMGLDLASKIDIASKALIFKREIDGEMHYYLFTRNYLPAAAVEKPENEHYRGWAETGHLVKTPGNMIDLNQIKEDAMEDAERILVAEIAMDPWGSREIAPALQADGFTVVDLPMNVRNLSEPMKLIQALVDSGRFHHDDNPATVWMFSNVEVFPDRNENIFPRKSSAEKKIDAAVATIIAVARAMAGVVAETKSFWETAE
ncbi:terminase TerL endonuclease subunit [Paucibacter sp. R3-3]|uniref:Terminase TerL endonuclease subunit n=1 Tax=Roseateles agri TaxID=3098619 RepID=A0ABU5DS91_9BURK|nr:terminase TerL endonuclease subunit [Paucibacter sp. R3-3]MDY0748515.1 terminase TerL endonuclease subunit [Paucibacter sp. R3-3]